MENKTTYEEKPLGYWEKDSYMQAVVEEFSPSILEHIIEKIEKVDGVKVTATREISEEAPGGIRFIYQEEEYELYYYPSNFTFYEMYARGPYYPTKSEQEKLLNATTSITFCMGFNSNPKKSFHLQLKIIYSIVPNLISIIDESAEKLLPRNWVKITTSSNATPPADNLYTIQAISAENGEVWLHTHGLARCGVPEIDILKTNKENYNVHYNLLSAYASYLLDNPKFEPSYAPIHLGFFTNDDPIIATSVSWTIALHEYSDLSVGNIDDREHEHNSKRNVIFVYTNKDNIDNHSLTRVSDINSKWSQNPLFFISKEETNIRTIIAKERFNYLKTLAKNETNEVLIKIALPITNSEDREHIYFKLISFENEKFKAELIQNPYADVKMQKGDIGYFTINDVSDWLVYTEQGTIYPSHVYLLDE
jgi:uncharacterized protein YegJ (DUF2314 family)